MIDFDRYGPITQVLRLSDDTMIYEWSDCAVFKNEETGYYAFASGAGCSCSYFEEDWSREYFRDQLVWHPTKAPAFQEALTWVRNNIENPQEKLQKLEQILRVVNEEYRGK